MGVSTVQRSQASKACKLVTECTKASLPKFLAHLADAVTVAGVLFGAYLHAAPKYDWPNLGQAGKISGLVLLCWSGLWVIVRLHEWRVKRLLREILGRLCPYLLPALSPYAGGPLLSRWVRDGGLHYAKRVAQLERDGTVDFQADQWDEFRSMVEHIFSTKSLRLSEVVVCHHVRGTHDLEARTRRVRALSAMYGWEGTATVVSFPDERVYSLTDSGFGEEMLSATRLMHSIQAYGRVRRFDRDAWLRSTQQPGVPNKTSVDPYVCECVDALCNDATRDLGFLCHRIGLRKEWYVIEQTFDGYGGFTRAQVRHYVEDDEAARQALLFLAERLPEWQVGQREKALHHALLIEQAKPGEKIIAADWAFLLGEKWEAALYDSIRKATQEALKRGVQLRRVFVVKHESDVEVAGQEVTAQTSDTGLPEQDTGEHFRWLTGDEAVGAWNPSLREALISKQLLTDQGLDFAALPDRQELFYNLFNGVKKKEDTGFIDARLRWFERIWARASPVWDSSRVGSDTAESEDEAQTEAVPAE